MDVLLAPHNDDESLFAAFTLLRHRPHVVVCLRSYANGSRYPTREIETAAAMRVLGCTWEQWPFPDLDVPWAEVREQIFDLPLRYDRCFAPYPRWAANGHQRGSLPGNGFGVQQHDPIGEWAREAFDLRYTGYLTYTRWAGKDRQGVPVVYEEGWAERKIAALACYTSQLADPSTAPHFLAEQHEFYGLEQHPEPEGA